MAVHIPNHYKRASAVNYVSWPRGVTVSTLDSESSDRGSNPREASFRTRLVDATSSCIGPRGSFQINHIGFCHDSSRSFWRKSGPTRT